MSTHNLTEDRLAAEQRRQVARRATQARLEARQAVEAARWAVRQAAALAEESALAWDLNADSIREHWGADEPHAALQNAQAAETRTAANNLRRIVSELTDVRDAI